jgi:H+/Cl- antiporter ClcA
LIGVGIAQLKKAYTSDFHDRLARERMTASEEKWVGRLARIGLSARGVILGIVGFFLIRAAAGHGRLHEVGVEGALQAIGSQPHGAILLIAVALGLVAYGLYMFAWAEYRRTP